MIKTWTAPMYPPGAPRPRTVDVLSVRYSIPKAKIREFAAAGRLTRSGEIFEHVSRKAVPGAVYELDIPDAPDIAEPAGEKIPLNIIFEDNDILVVNKPAGLVVHPAPGHPDGTLVNAVLNHCPGALSVGWKSRPGIVHRLDRDTSGAIVIAKTQEAMTGLAEAFFSLRVRKTYRTLVHGLPDPKSGVVETLIGRSPSNRKKMAVVENGGRMALSEYNTLQSFGNVSELAVKIVTGRTHQIRVHMKYIGHPVLGDAVYGRAAYDSALPQRPGRQMLHAWKLEFPHPIDGRIISVEAPLPQDYSDIVSSLIENATK